MNNKLDNETIDAIINALCIAKAQCTREAISLWDDAPIVANDLIDEAANYARILKLLSTFKTNED